ncbi:MAG: hypothetical protein NDJ72_09665 [Elusimicrobia bacterium]|nr:hypothetical protein [Elusimicrobiota bacterium]
MRKIAAVLLALAAACAPEPSRDFELGLIGPVGPGVASAARAAGLTIREAAPEGADTRSAGAERMADWSDLRLHVARAAIEGRTGVFFILPKTADARELTSYPEEWQALARVARETAAIRPVLEAGIETALPFPAPAGAAARAWRYQGRLYVLLVNDGEAALPVSPDDLRPWRALFEVRADARDLLSPCPEGRCLPAGRVLWLEGRL